ncbi:hypothetical protein OCL90_14485, partial [Enterococcus faecalis]|nr:hypothetical protein [Enterococcus faecalis]
LRHRSQCINVRMFVLRPVQLAHIYGCPVPETLSITSFNNATFSTLTQPYLTSNDIDTSKSVLFVHSYVVFVA